MPKRSNEFQKIVKLLKALNCNNLKVIESHIIKELASGVEREVDIYIENKIGEIHYVICCEVIGRKRKADLNWVEQMISKHRKLITDKLILISKSGFTKNAYNEAQLYKALPITFKTVETTNWKEAVILLSGGKFLHNFYNWKILKVLSRSGEVVVLKNKDHIVYGGKDTCIKDFVNGLIRHSSVKELESKVNSNDCNLSFNLKYESGKKGEFLMYKKGQIIEIGSILLKFDGRMRKYKCEYEIYCDEKNEYLVCKDVNGKMINILNKNTRMGVLEIDGQILPLKQDT